MNVNFMYEIMIRAVGIDTQVQVLKCQNENPNILYCTILIFVESKLNTFSDGFKVIRKIFYLFRDYKPYLFFSYLGIAIGLFALALFLPVFYEYLQTGLVPNFPTLIVSGVFLIFRGKSIFL